MPVDLIDDFDNEYSFIDNDGPIFYFKTDLKAPRGRVIAIDIRKPERKNWKEIIPAGQGEPQRHRPGRQPVRRQLSEGRAHRR